MSEMTLETFYIINQTGLIETYLGWAASWNSGRWKSPSKHLNVPSTAERRQKIAAKHHGIYEISTFARRRLEVCNKGIWDVRTQAYQIRSEYRQRWRKVHQSWFLISRLSCILAHSSELMTNGSHEQENEGGRGGEGRTFSSRARQKSDSQRRRHFKPSILTDCMV